MSSASRTLARSRLMFPLVAQGEQDFCKRLQVMAVIGRQLHLLYSAFFVSVHAANFQKEALVHGKRTDHIIAGAKGEIGILRVGVDREQRSRLRFRRGASC